MYKGIVCTPFWPHPLRVLLVRYSALSEMATHVRPLNCTRWPHRSIVAESQCHWLHILRSGSSQRRFCHNYLVRRVTQLYVGVRRRTLAATRDLRQTLDRNIRDQAEQLRKCEVVSSSVPNQSGRRR